jgi:hypothetical protein
MSAFGYIRDMLMDPDGSPSSTRWCGVLSICTACGCAIAGLALKRSDTAGIVAAIGAVGTGCLFARTRSTTTP